MEIKTMGVRRMPMESKFINKLVIMMQLRKKLSNIILIRYGTNDTYNKFADEFAHNYFKFYMIYVKEFASQTLFEREEFKSWSGICYVVNKQLVSEALLFRSYIDALTDLEEKYKYDYTISGIISDIAAKFATEIVIMLGATPVSYNNISGLCAMSVQEAVDEEMTAENGSAQPLVSILKKYNNKGENNERG